MNKLTQNLMDELAKLGIETSVAEKTGISFFRADITKTSLAIFLRTLSSHTGIIPTKIFPADAINMRQYNAPVEYDFNVYYVHYEIRPEEVIEPENPKLEKHLVETFLPEDHIREEEKAYLDFLAQIGEYEYPAETDENENSVHGDNSNPEIPKRGIMPVFTSDGELTYLDNEVRDYLTEYIDHDKDDEDNFNLEENEDFFISVENTSDPELTYVRVVFMMKDFDEEWIEHVFEDSIFDFDMKVLTNRIVVEVKSIRPEF